MTVNPAPTQVLDQNDRYVHRFTVLDWAFWRAARFAPAKLACDPANPIDTARRPAFRPIPIPAADSGERHDWRLGCSLGRLSASAARTASDYVVPGRNNTRLHGHHVAGSVGCLGDKAEFP